MKTKTIFIAAVLFCSYQNGNAQCGGHSHDAASNKHEKSETKKDIVLSSATFKVYGNCSMCKNRIENALMVDGVANRYWNVDTKMMEVKYEPSKISEEKIHSLIAGAGHDTEKVKAKDETYNNLPGCCQYERASTKKEKEPLKKMEQDDVHQHQQ